MSALRIYGIARTRAFRALWIADELGLDYEHVPVEIGQAGARQPDYLAINPNGRLPAIDDGGFILWESLAITLYLAKKHSTGRLYPATLEGEAKTWQWSLWSVQEVDRGCNIWSLHAVRLPLPSATRNGSPKRSRCWKGRSGCSTVRSPTVPICSATTSRSPTSTWLRWSAARSTWTCRRRRGSAPGSGAASIARRRSSRAACARRPTTRFRSR